MFIVHCFVHVKEDQVEAFAQASIANSRASLQEEACKRFDVIQQLDDPTRFVLVEGYDTADGLEFHKTQEHYLTWKATVEDMQAEPRHAVKYQNLHPGDETWN